MFESELSFMTLAVRNCASLKSKENRTHRARKEKSDRSLANIDILTEKVLASIFSERIF